MDLRTSGQVAKQLGVPRWKFLYWLDTGVLDEPAVRIPGRRLFTADEVKRIKEELGPKLQEAQRPRCETHGDVSY